MLTIPDNDAWKRLWDERGLAVKRVLGETNPPGQVVPFTWKDFLLPGACALTFDPSSTRIHYTYMSLGLSQPIGRGDVVPSWEFAVKAKELAQWPIHMLHDLLTYWVSQKPNIRPGLFLPLTFFLDVRGLLCAGLTDKREKLNVVGATRGVFLWNDLDRLQFNVSSGDFGLMAAVTVTDDEIQLARETTPPHMLLLLKRMQVGQISDPFRQSVMSISGAVMEWKRIRVMSHREAIDELVN